jgi:hypothetical protein
MNAKEKQNAAKKVASALGSLQQVCMDPSMGLAPIGTARKDLLQALAPFLDAESAEALKKTVVGD